MMIEDNLNEQERDALEQLATETFSGSMLNCPNPRDSLKIGWKNGVAYAREENEGIQDITSDLIMMIESERTAVIAENDRLNKRIEKLRQVLIAALNGTLCWTDQAVDDALNDPDEREEDQIRWEMRQEEEAGMDWETEGFDELEQKESS